MIAKTIKKHGWCHTAVITKVTGQDSTIYINRAFPALENYISGIYTRSGTIIRVPSPLRKNILISFSHLKKLEEEGYQTMLLNTQKMQKVMQNELADQELPKTLKLIK